jgi:hypothetical protein
MDDAAARLEALVRRYLPEDSDPHITDVFVHQWTTALPAAERVVLDWIDFHGARKLAARWLDAEGKLVVWIGESSTPRISVAEFAREWADLVMAEGRTVVFEDCRI